MVYGIYLNYTVDSVSKIYNSKMQPVRIYYMDTMRWFFNRTLVNVRLANKRLT